MSRSLLIHAVVFGVCACVMVGCGGSAKRDQADVVAPPASSAAGAVTVRAGAAGATSVRGAAGVVVDVAGAVRRPGVYRLPKGSRVHEAIAAAGGATRAADTSTLNRAADIVDGEQVLVPSRAAVASSTPGGAGAPGAAPGKVSINTADVAAFDSLPGIGPVTAQRIVDDRTANGPFTSVDDLDRVSGIGSATLAQLEPLVTP